MNSSQQGKKTNSKDVAVNIFIFFVSLLTAIFFIEVFLYNFTKIGSYDFKKFARRTSDDAAGHCYTSNHNGYFEKYGRDEVFIRDAYYGDYPFCVFYDKEKRRTGYFPDRKKEIIIFGDSFAFGEGLKEEDTLGYLLGEKFLKYNFRNYGASGFDIQKIAERIIDAIGREKKVKTMIYFYNINDVKKSPFISMQQKHINDLQNIRWDRYKSPEKRNFPQIISSSTLYHLYEKSRVLKRETILTIRNYKNMYFDVSNRRALSDTINLLVTISGIAKTNKVDFYLVIYPILYRDDLGRYPFMKIHRSLVSIAERHGIKCIDAFAAFERYSSFDDVTLHPIDSHPNGIANRAVVDYLFEEGGLLKTSLDKD